MKKHSIKLILGILVLGLVLTANSCVLVLGPSYIEIYNYDPEGDKVIYIEISGPGVPAGNLLSPGLFYSQYFTIEVKPGDYYYVRVWDDGTLGDFDDHDGTFYVGYDETLFIDFDNGLY